MPNKKRANLAHNRYRNNYNHIPALLQQKSKKQIHMIEKLKQNKQNAVAFYKMAYEGNPKKATDLYVTMDFFRFDNNGKIIEHWDSMQQIPKTSAHKNTMY